MRIAVIGAGLAGVTTAYELARSGHDTVVYERRGSIAAEGSFAPACVNAPGLAFVSSVLGPRAALPRAGASRPLCWPWLMAAWRSMRQPGHPGRLQALAGLARFSQERLAQLEAAHELSYDRHEGVLAMLRHPRQAAKLQAALQGPREDFGMRWVDADEARRIEPGLDEAVPLQGALHWPRGHAANGRQFAHALKAEAQRLGARFLFHQEVVALDLPAGQAPVELRSQPCTELLDSGLPAPATTLLDDLSPSFDAVVLCSGGATRRLLPDTPLPLGRACVHTVTAPLREGDAVPETIGPRGALLDLSAGISIARMGDRLRVAGRARCGTPPRQPDKRELVALYGGLEACFPGAARTARAQAWAGHEANLPDGLPAVGRAGPGVWLNLGHGAHSWASAPATACLVSALIGGASTPFDPTPLDPGRLR